MAVTDPQPAVPEVKLRWYQYRLRTLLVANCVVALALGMYKWLGPIVIPCTLATLGGLGDYLLCQAGGGKHKLKGALGGGLGGLAGSFFYWGLLPHWSVPVDLGGLSVLLGIATALAFSAIYGGAKRKDVQKANTGQPQNSAARHQPSGDGLA